MYRSFFGLRERPFELTPNPRFLVLTDGHREALSNLEYGIASRRGITALIGDAGTGKTTLIRTALDRQVEKVHTVYLHNPALTRGEFVETLATRFRLTDEAKSSKAVLLAELEAALHQAHGRGETSVLIVDEAQSLPIDLLEEIRLLGNIETNETKLLSIVLVGQPELAVRLNDESLRQLKQRIALRCELRPLSAGETAAYLAGRIRAAGGIGAQVFTREAVMLIHEKSSGIPRLISVIADNALLTAYALRTKPINSRIVDEVCRDLDLLDRPEPAPAAQAAAAGVTSTVVDAASSASTVLTVVAAPAHETLTTATALAEPQGNVDPATAGKDAIRDHAGPFSSWYPKRRRFSLFKGQ
jgi:general secretion pathway protein A